MIDRYSELKDLENITIIIPAYNEEGRIGNVVQTIVSNFYKVLVVDDRSTDNTVQEASLMGAEVIKKEQNTGYLESVKLGFQEAETDLVVTMDADGEHDPADICRLLKPLFSNEADLVLGTRPQIARYSEKVINWLTNLRVKTRDCGTGMRALRRELAVRMHMPGYCTCGTFVLEAKLLGARILDIPINNREISKPRRNIAWGHFRQIFYVLKMLMFMSSKAGQT